MKKVIFIVLILNLISCRKDETNMRLKGEKSFLLGEWELVHTYFLDFNDPNGVEFVSAEEQEGTYRIIFEKQGFVTFYHGDKILEAGYTHFPGFGFEAKKIGTALDPKQISFNIWLDGNMDRNFAGTGILDSLATGTTPRIDTGHVAYRDYYRRVK